MISTDEKYMQRCFELAAKGICYASPNPMVGAVIVHKGEIIGEGYHEKHGQAHAEPNAIRSVQNPELLKESTLYVNLEPCSHFGKTPPCAGLIIEKKIPRVVICNVDPFHEVAGRGIKMMQDAGIEVSCGLLEAEGRELNKRFFTFHEKKRPYIILKWAQSADGFIDSKRTDNTQAPFVFSNPQTQLLNHRTRTEEAAILVGTNTVLLDNPQLTNRLCEGKSPMRLAIDREGKIPMEYKIMDGSVPTLIFTENDRASIEGVDFIKTDFSQDIITRILSELYKREKLSLIVEGGSKVLKSFIEAKMWDEARVEIADVSLGKGIDAPKLESSMLDRSEKFDQNIMLYYRNI